MPSNLGKVYHVNYKTNIAQRTDMLISEAVRQSSVKLILIIGDKMEQLPSS